MRMGLMFIHVHLRRSDEQKVVRVLHLKLIIRSHCHLKHFIVDKSGYNFCWYMLHIIRYIRIHVTVGGFNKRVLKAEHSS